MFHSTLYDWLIDRGLADDLLEVSRCKLRLLISLLTIRLDQAHLP